MKLVLHLVVRLIRKSMHIYKATSTLPKSHNQQQNKNIHTNFLFLANSATRIFWLDSLDPRIWGDAGDSFTKWLWNFRNGKVTKNGGRDVFEMGLGGF